MNCPYCNKEMKQGMNEQIYGRRYGHGKIIICVDYPKCDSWVGCHRSGKPLGFPANKELRELRKKCHAKFDKTWKGKKRSRGDAYKILSKMMGLPEEKTHIAMFNEQQCKKLLTFNLS